MGQLDLRPVFSESYWKAAAPVSLHSIHGRLHGTVAEVNSCDRDAEPKIFTIWSFTEIIYCPLVYILQFTLKLVFRKIAKCGIQEKHLKYKDMDKLKVEDRNSGIIYT